MNGRAGADKSVRNYTCHTSRGSSTIDYVVLSMELFPHIVDFYIDTYDKCLSDVHCPVYIIMSCTKSVLKESSNVTLNTHEYKKTKNIKCRWEQDLSNEYTLSFNIEEIQNFQLQLNHILSQISNVTQTMVDNLYTHMNDIFI